MTRCSLFALNLILILGIPQTGMEFIPSVSEHFPQRIVPGSLKFTRASS